MGDISIKIKIAEREYPMKVAEAEEERLRLAGRAINDRLRFFKEEFRIEDKQDLLAMVAFECMADKLKQETESGEGLSTISRRISTIQQLFQAANTTATEG